MVARDASASSHLLHGLTCLNPSTATCLLAAQIASWKRNGGAVQYRTVCVGFCLLHSWSGSVEQGLDWLMYLLVGKQALLG